MVNFGQSSEDQNVARNADGKTQDHEVSDVNEDQIGKWTRQFVGFIQVQHFSIIFPFYKISYKDEYMKGMKNGRIMMSQKLLLRFLKKTFGLVKNYVSC